MKNVMHDLTAIPDDGVETVSGACEAHGEFTVKAMYISGSLLNASPMCPKCDEIAKAEAHEKGENEFARRRKRAQEKPFYDAGIPKRFIEAEKYVPTCDEAKVNLEVIRAYCEQFDDRRSDGGCLLLCGTTGTGKTHLACKAGIKLIQRGHSVRYSTASEAVRYIRGSYGRTAGYTEQQAINLYTDPDLLILDELGEKASTDHERAKFSELIDIRSRQKKPTIGITNGTVMDLKENVSERLVSRFKHNGTMLVFNWKDYREGNS